MKDYLEQLTDILLLKMADERAAITGPAKLRQLIVELIGREDWLAMSSDVKGEIESVLAQNPAVREVIVLVREDGGPLGARHKRLVAYVTPQAHTNLRISELQSYLREKLPEYMVPSAFVVLESLPLTPNGKIDRKALPAPDSARPELAHAYAAPRTETEATLAAIAQGADVHYNILNLGIRGMEQAAREKNTRLIGSYANYCADANPLYIAYTVSGIGFMVEYVIDQMMAGTWKPEYKPFGLAMGPSSAGMEVCGGATPQMAAKIKEIDCVEEVSKGAITEVAGGAKQFTLTIGAKCP